MRIGLNTLPLVKVLIPFGIGICIADYNPAISDYALQFIFLYALLILVFVYKRTPYKLGQSLGLLVLFLLIGFLHHQSSDIKYKKDHFSIHSDAKFLILSPRENKQLDNKVRSICRVLYAGYAADSIVKTEGLLMTYLDSLSLSEINPGDLIIAKAKFQKEKLNTNPYVFNYKRYLKNRGIFHKSYCREYDYHVIATDKVDILDRASRYQEFCQAIFTKHISKGNNLAVASAMVLGERNLINDELYSAFTETGAVHVLAVSGLHVGIVAKIIALILFLLPSSNQSWKVLRILLSITAIWTFAIITGAAAAVIRAATMATLYFVAQLFGRKGLSFNVLASAALFMLLLETSYLFQAGFQFSFLALTGILFFYKRIRDIVSPKHKVIKYIWSMIALSLSAQILVSPLAIFYFHKLPTYFWLTGILVVPLAAIILSFGLALILCDTLFGSAAFLTVASAKILDSVLWFMNEFILLVNKLPYTSAEDLWISSISIILFYLALLSFAFLIKTKKTAFLLATLLVLNLQAFIHINENRKMRQVKKLVIYDIYSESMAHLFYNSRLSELSPKRTESNQIEYITGNNVLAHRITSKQKYKEDSLNNGFYYVDDNLFLLNPDKSVLNYKSTIPIDLLVLSKDSYLGIDKLAENFQINKIVVDGTLSRKKNLLKKAAYSNDIPIHFTSDHSAFEYPL